MLVIPAPLPDEIDRGYLGRIDMHNGLVGQAEIVEMLQQMIGKQAGGRRNPEVIELLALASQYELTAFLKHHTLMPYWKIIATRSGQDADFWIHSSLLRTQGMRLLQKAAYFCLQCVQEDIEFHGQSYWRRQHQLPGLSSCKKHGQQLRYVNSRNAFLSPPSVFCETASIAHGGAKMQSAKENLLQQRFVDIWAGLAEHGQSIYSGVAARVFREKAQEYGFTTRAGQMRRRWLSDYIVKSFGSEWLENVCPRLARKLPGHEFQTIDQHILVNNGKALAHYYVLIAAVLFDTADEALLALISLKQADLGRSGRTPENRITRFAHAH